MKKIILCADDYGQNEGISQGILQLLAAKRLSATSCLVNHPNWPTFASWLKPFFAKADIGLHLNLTHGQSFTEIPGLTIHRQFPSINRILVATYLRRVTVSAIKKELNAQLDSFEQAFGSTPDFLDGHQHVHHLPVVRQAVAEIWQERLQEKKLYFRSVWHMKGQCKSALKAFIIRHSGAATFDRWLKANHIAHNTSFSGVYEFAHAANFPSYMAQFLKSSQTGGLIMCHPGLSPPETDPIATARLQELQFLLSQNFVALCERLEIVLLP